MDNRYQRFTAKEKEQFVEWWNTGVPTDELAERFRRPKTAINALVARLRKEGFTLISLYDRFQAVRDYKAVKAFEREDDEPGTDLDEVCEDFDEVAEFEDLANTESDAEVGPEPIQTPTPQSDTVAITTVTLLNGVEVSRVTTYRDRDRI